MDPGLSTTVSDTLKGRLARHRDDIVATACRHRGRSVAIFGSVARGDATPDSDIYLLVDFEPGSSLFDLLHLQDELQALLGCDVHVVSRQGFKARDEHIRSEAKAAVGRSVATRHPELIGMVYRHASMITE